MRTFALCLSALSLLLVSTSEASALGLRRGGVVARRGAVVNINSNNAVAGGGVGVAAARVGGFHGGFVGRGAFVNPGFGFGRTAFVGGGFVNPAFGFGHVGFAPAFGYGGVRGFNAVGGYGLGANVVGYHALAGCPMPALLPAPMMLMAPPVVQTLQTQTTTTSSQTLIGP